MPPLYYINKEIARDSCIFFLFVHRLFTCNSQISVLNFGPRSTESAFWGWCGAKWGKRFRAPFRLLFDSNFSLCFPLQTFRRKSQKTPPLFIQYDERIRSPPISVPKIFVGLSKKPPHGTAVGRPEATIGDLAKESTVPILAHSEKQGFEGFSVKGNERIQVMALPRHRYVGKQ